MRRLPKYLRVAVAIACFLSVNAAFLAPVVAETLCLESVPDFSWAAKMQFLPALLALNFAVVAAILAVTALFGRVYCSTVCPFGVLQDVAIRIRRLFTKKKRAADVPRTRWRVALVGAFAVLAALGFLSLAAQLDPYSIYGRFAANVLRPALQRLANLGAAWSDAHEKYWLMGVEVAVPVVSALAAAVVSVAVVLALAVWKGRWFCNRLCPVGACLALASRRPLVKLGIDASKCVSCGMCERVCKAGAIDAKAKTLDNAQCVRCLDCIGACGKGAVRI